MIRVMERLVYFGIVLFCLIVALAAAQASPFATFRQGGIVIVLTDEPCALDAIKNLAYRATWTESGKTTEGCFAPHPAGVVLFYFADKTVTVAAMSDFKKVGAI